MTSYPDMAAWLARTPRADRVFGEIVAALDAHPDDNGVIIRTQTMSGDFLHVANQTVDVSNPVLNDLVEKGLVRIGSYNSRGEPVFEVPADALDFARWRWGQPTPIEQIDERVVRLVDDGGFAQRHPDAATHLRAVFELLNGETAWDNPAITIAGDHLRKALIDVVGAAAALANPDENLERVLRPVRVAAAQRADTAVAMLIDYVLAVFTLDHAVEHVRDEVHEGREPAGVGTIRRAAFLTAVACFELDRAPLPRDD